MLVSVEITPDETAERAGGYSFADPMLTSLVEYGVPERTRLMLSSTIDSICARSEAVVSLESDMDMRCLIEAECDASISDETAFERPDRLTWAIFKLNSSSESIIDDGLRETAGLGDLAFLSVSISDLGCDIGESLEAVGLLAVALEETLGTFCGELVFEEAIDRGLATLALEVVLDDLREMLSW